MNGMSQINQGGLGHYGGYATMSSSEVAVNSYESLNADLTIQTRDGDVVTLTASRYSEVDAYEYSSRGEISGKRGEATSTYNEREITLSSGEQFTFTVHGELDEDELEDIESIVSGIDAIIGEMAEGDMADAVAKALAMGSYDSISRYEADISHEQFYGAYAESRSAEYEGGRGHGVGHEHGYGYGRMPEPSADSGQKAALQEADDPTTNFMGKVRTLLEDQKEETLAWARQPLSQLFSHHMDALKPPEDAEKTADDATVDNAVEAAGTDEEVSTENEISTPEEKPLYKLLEEAAAKVDDLINTMIKDLFENTLNRII